MKDLTAENDPLFLKMISWFRFPLIVGVVFIHANLSVININGENILTGFPQWIHYLIHLFSNIFPAICVPLFFFISGYLFFYKSDFNTSEYLKKLKRRIRTLLIPYILWNIISYVNFCLKYYFSPIKMADVSLESFLAAFWNFNLVSYTEILTTPLNIPLWYVRDLMVVIVLSPLIFYSIKKANLYPVIILFLCWFFKAWIEAPGFSITAFFFFTAGAWFSISKSDVIATFQKTGYIACFAYPVVAAVNVILYQESYSGYLYKIAIACGILSMFYLIPKLLKENKLKINDYLSKTVFFVFAFHSLIITKLIKGLFILIKPESPLTALVIYFICPIITILFSILIYKYMMRFFPMFTSILCGNR